MTWRADYAFDLPERLIAQSPPERRGESRLLHVPGVGAVEDLMFDEIVGRFRGDEVLIVNDTRVVPARVLGQKATGGAAEVFVVEPCVGIGPDPEVLCLLYTSDAADE